MEKSNTGSYAEMELNILVKTVKDPIIKPFVNEIIALCDKFGKSGQSGGSAPFTASALADAIKKLCLQEPICEITGIDDEWVDVSEITQGGKADIAFQNKRCFALFKTKKGRCFYSEAIIFKTQKGITYHSNGGAFLSKSRKIGSSQPIKKFPFKPKTFYIDVIEKETSPHNWSFFIKDEKQLLPVAKHYNLKFKISRRNYQKTV